VVGLVFGVLVGEAHAVAEPLGVGTDRAAEEAGHGDHFFPQVQP
jgi:hypothetical protein